MSNLDIAVDPQVLESLDFDVPCGHSQHTERDFTHDGPAEYIAVSYHDCPGAPEKSAPYYYPCCAVWAAFVTMNRVNGREIICTRCGQHGTWSEFVNIIDNL